MRRGITLQYTAPAGSGWGTASYIYGPETSIVTQIAYAKSTVAATVAAGSGSAVKVEIWTENFPVKRYTGRPGQASVPSVPSGSGPHSMSIVTFSGEETETTEAWAEKKQP